MIELTDVEARTIADVLEAARSDIWQTLRVSQYNLTGVDPCSPNDPPAIPSKPRLIHQAGIDESRRVIGEIQRAYRLITDKPNAAVTGEVRSNALLANETED